MGEDTGSLREEALLCLCASVLFAGAGLLGGGEADTGGWGGFGGGRRGRQGRAEPGELPMESPRAALHSAPEIV